MDPMRWFWLGGGVVLVGAGLVTGWVLTRRRTELRAGARWAEALAAVETAHISRDAGGPLPEADVLLSRAEELITHHGGVEAAMTVSRLAQDADRRYRARTQ